MSLVLWWWRLPLVALLLVQASGSRLRAPSTAQQRESPVRARRRRVRHYRANRVTARGARVVGTPVSRRAARRAPCAAGCADKLGSQDPGVSSRERSRSSGRGVVEAVGARPGLGCDQPSHLSAVPAMPAIVSRSSFPEAFTHECRSGMLSDIRNYLSRDEANTEGSAAGPSCDRHDGKHKAGLFSPATFTMVRSRRHSAMAEISAFEAAGAGMLGTNKSSAPMTTRAAPALILIALCACTRPTGAQLRAATPEL